MTKGGIFLDYFTEYASPVGPLVLKSDGIFLTGLFPGNTHAEKGRPLPVFALAEKWLDTYFRGELPAVEVPILARGTPFQERVWARLEKIPYGETITYGQIAREIGDAMGKRMSAQAVGQAVGKNPVSILIPCHRVVGAKGQLTGYSGGMEIKIRLLQLEGWNIQNNTCFR